MQAQSRLSAAAAACGDPGSHETLSLEGFLPYRLSALAESVSRAFAQHYERRFGITIAEWRVIAVLGERGSQSTRAVIGRTRMDRVRVSRAAIRLEDKGLIARTPQTGDQRAHRLSLSARGDAVYRQVVPLARALQADLVQALGETDLRTLDGLLRTLQGHADRLAALVPVAD